MYVFLHTLRCQINEQGGKNASRETCRKKQTKRQKKVSTNPTLLALFPPYIIAYLAPESTYLQGPDLCKVFKNSNVTRKTFQYHCVKMGWQPLETCQILSAEDMSKKSNVWKMIKFIAPYSFHFKCQHPHCSRPSRFPGWQAGLLKYGP